MKHWLMKSEPDTYGIADLERDRRTAWEGVRNYTARIFLRAMRTGDRAFFYHSSTNPLAIVGEIAITRAAYPDPSQFDARSDYYDPKATKAAPRWFAVDVAFVRRIEPPVTRAALAADPLLKRMRIFTEGRLSVTPVTPAEWRRVGQLAAPRR